MLRRLMTYTALAWALLMPASCTKETGNGAQEGERGELVAPVLKADKEILVYNNETADYSYVMLYWKNASTGTMVPDYTVEITKSSDSSFSQAESFQCNRLNMSFTVNELKNIAGTQTDNFSILARLTASADGKNMTSGKITVNVRKNEDGNLPGLYVTGAATPGGWELSKAMKMYAFQNVYSCQIDLRRNEDFKFVLQQSSWWPGIINKSSDPLVYQPVLVQEEPDGSEDRKFRVAKSGKYELNVDASDLNSITFEAKLLEEMKREVIYMAGEATGYGYELGSTEARLLKPDEENEDLYVWTGHLEGKKDFKFLASETEWVPSYNRDAKASTYWKMVYRTSYDEPDEKFQVQESGTYKVSINTKDMTVSCVLQSGN